MPVSKEIDSGDKQSLIFPKVTSESDVTIGHRYILAMQFAGGDGVLVGPFEAASIPVCITKHYPLIGHFALHTKANETSEPERVFVPRGGMVHMYGIRYSLHEATASAIAYFQNAFRLGKSVLLAERSRQRDCKYLD